MRHARHLWSVGAFFLVALNSPAQQTDSPSSAPDAAAPAVATVPRLIKFTGALKDLAGKPLTGPVEVDFAIYKSPDDAAALWQETQTLELDAQGRYTVLLGAMQPEGLPIELFTTGEARWLEVGARGAAALPRVLLVSVPYALKAGDAETLGGKPASAYQLAPSTGFSSSLSGSGAVAGKTATTTTTTTSKNSKRQATPAVTGTTPVTTAGGTIGYLPLWDSTSDITSSLLYQNPSTGNFGIGTTAPGASLDINANFAGLRLRGTGTHQVTVTGATSGRLGQDGSGFFFASDTNGGALRFLTNNGALNEWLRITSAGNLGIGTNTPRAFSRVNVTTASTTAPYAIFAETSVGGNAAAINGQSSSSGSAGITGYNTSGGGVQGFDTFNVGVAGLTNNGIGVDGSSETGIGVRGRVGNAAGKLFSGVDATFAEKFNVTSDGTVHANAYQNLSGTPIGGAVTVVASATVTPANFNVVQVNCPAGYQAVGGGIDLGNVFTMVVSSSGPTFGGSRLLFRSNGQGGAPDGWQGTAINNGTSNQTFVLAVICTKPGA